EGVIPDPKAFLNPVPHMSFVWGDENVDYLRRRFEALRDHPLFSGLEFSDDPKVIRSWAPVLLPGRKKSQPIAATRIPARTDVDFASLSRNLDDYRRSNDVRVRLELNVVGRRKEPSGVWRIRPRRTIGHTPSVTQARFVFVGAGGGALSLLQE